MTQRERYELRNGEIYDWEEMKSLMSEKEYRERFKNILTQLQTNNRVSLVNLMGDSNESDYFYVKNNGYWYNIENKLNYDKAGKLDEDLAKFIVNKEVLGGFQSVISTEKDISKYDKYHNRFNNEENDEYNYRENGALFDLSRQKSPQDLKGKRIRHTKKQCKKQPVVRVNFRKMI